MAGTARCAVTARTAGGIPERYTSDHARCAAKRGADSAARCPYQGTAKLDLKLAFAQSDAVLKKMLPLIACALGLYGCASTGPIPHLSDYRCQRLVTQADQLAMAGGPLPEEIQKLNPVQVYGDHGNIVIALQRNAQGEQGFYIVPTTSSYDPRFRPDPDWTFALVNPNDAYLNNLYQYSRVWRH